MATTRATARQAIGKLTMPRWRIRGTTTNITTDDQVVDSSLEGEGYDGDNSLMDKWIWLNTASNASVERIIQGNTGATGAISIRGANLAAESATAAFEIHTFAPSDIHDALNWAMNNEYKSVYNEVEDVTLSTFGEQQVYSVPSTIQDISEIYLERPMTVNFTDNLVGDYGSFETWTTSTQPAGTDAATNLTLSKATDADGVSLIRSDSYAVKAVCAASTTGTHYFTALTTPSLLDGVTSTFSMWVYCTEATRVRVTIEDINGAGTTDTYSAYHGGGGMERLSVTRTNPSGLTTIKAGIACASGATALTFYYESAIWTFTGRMVENRWEKLYNWTIYEGKIRFPYYLPERRALMLVGKKPLTAFSTDAGTTELDEPEIQVIYYSALVYLYRQLRAQQTGKQTNVYDDDIGYWELELARTRRKYLMSMPITTRIDQYWR